MAGGAFLLATFVHSQFCPARGQQAFLAAADNRDHRSQTGADRFPRAFTQTLAGELAKHDSVRLISPSTVRCYERLGIAVALRACTLGLEVILERTARQSGKTNYSAGIERANANAFLKRTPRHNFLPALLAAALAATAAQPAKPIANWANLNQLVTGAEILVMLANDKTLRGSMQRVSPRYWRSMRRPARRRSPGKISEASVLKRSGLRGRSTLIQSGQYDMFPNAGESGALAVASACRHADLCGAA